MNQQVEVLPDKNALIERSLAVVIEKVQAAIQERGECTIALAGGSTPKPLYEALAEQSLPWEKVQVFWGDERYVSAEHADSNQKMARQAWLNRVSIPSANVHPVPTGAASPEADAEQYERELRQTFKTSEGEVPAFDMILLGLGDDGHTASLFPHTEALAVRDRLVTVGHKEGQPRITFTVPLLNQARCVIFIVSGANKRSALQQIFAAAADERAYPARLVQPQGELWWLLDAAAGEGMK
ncbi:MAG: 6-phosphogluconolactonase [Cyanophyceae cyanobacterium]